MDYDARESLSEKAEALTARARRFKCDNVTSICGRCQSAHIFRMKHKNEPVIICQELGKPVPGNIEECNKFVQIGTISVWKMAELAKLIDKEDKHVGFVPGDT